MNAWEDIKRAEFWELFFTAVALVVVGFALVLLVRVAAADGRSDFCYVYGSRYSEGLPHQAWYVEAHRPWREDRRVGTFATQAEALDAARAVGCRLFTERP